jgi:hypothetical protein
VSVGAPQTVDSGATNVTLTGTAVDPNTPPRALALAWAQTSGPPVTLNGADTTTATFTAPTLDVNGPVVLGFSLTASNAVSASAATTVRILPRLVPDVLAVTNLVSSEGRSRRNVSGVIANAGDLLVAFAASDGPATGGQTLTVFGGTGLTWSLVRRTNTQLGTSEIWTSRATTALSNGTVSARQSVDWYQQLLTVVTFTGAGGVGASEGASAPTGAPRVTLVTTIPGSLVFGVGNDWDNRIARTLPAGQALAHQYLASDNDTMWVQSLLGAVATAGTSVTLEDTAPTTDQWNYSAVEIVPLQP